MDFDLNTLWFVLIAVLYAGFFVLEGFDFGVGILLPLIAREDVERRQVINTIGPHWDGNEVWLLTAGGATFAAFPEWYATLFSGFYLPLFLLLVALILRGVAFEYRSKDDGVRWRRNWDHAIFGGSLVPALLLGVAFANLVRGVPIDAQKHYVGGFFNLLNPYALVAGLAAVAGFALHGALFLSMKTDGVVRERAQAWAKRLWPVSLVLVATLFGLSFVSTDIKTPAIVIATLGLVTLVLAGVLQRRGAEGKAFVATSLTIVLGTASLFAILFPRVMVSSLDPAFSLTIHNASSSPYTLKLMTVVALTFVPIVLAYQAWSYWVFRKRVTRDPQTLTY